MFAPRRHNHSVILVDSHALLHKLIDKNLTTADAARATGISVALICRITKTDRVPINLRTAARLKKAFGDDVIIIDNGKE